MASRTITLDGARTRPSDITDIACAGARVSLAPEGLDRAAGACRAAVEIAARRPFYGRTTGVGANRSQDAGDDGGHDLRLLRSHAGGIGPHLPDAHVRAMLAVRANQILAGGAGLQPAFAEALAAALNSGYLPRIHEIGGLGTGDLTALAETGLTLIGERPWAGPHAPTGPSSAGRSPSSREPQPGEPPGSGSDGGAGPGGGTAPEPIVLRAGDALAFCSSNALTVGQAALGWSQIAGLLAATHVVAALSLLAVDGSAEPYDERVHARRPHPGGVAVASEMRRLLGDAHPAGARVQDPFGYRCLPQVHGPAVDAAAALARVLEIEINAASENPLVSAADLTVHHHGGFHQATLGLTLDHLRVALLHTAHLSAARLATLMEPAFTGLRPFLAEGPPASSGAMILEYSANSALAGLRNAAYPAALGHAVLSRGMEEHASFAAQSARQTLEAASAYRLVLACELVAAVRALRGRGARPAPPAPVAAAFATAAAELDADAADRPLSADVETASFLLDRLAAL
ncbi:aromatic amino acid lyase [Sphaerisporangium sp. TRM90804]|uniref:aromatic amino acid ammonia-lyase n=1 Tax=Sphaerisporangium sp. TRM90804 TaxID=3031113 RepID=UPI00244B3236|nr:aromatic amino acid lyase [Sphaerisporangium sp. TRM90804]MDH2424011.1 aromatic amino acid lyase [Sphaerisporangium sp. TRM90804]